MSRINPAMSDGRAFTTYLSSGIYNQQLESEAGVHNDTSYRAFLQNNAEKVRGMMGRLTPFSAPGIPPIQKLRPVADKR